MIILVNYQRLRLGPPHGHDQRPGLGRPGELGADAALSGVRLPGPRGEFLRLTKIYHMCIYIYMHRERERERERERDRERYRYTYTTYKPQVRYTTPLCGGPEANSSSHESNMFDYFKYSKHDFCGWGLSVWPRGYFIKLADLDSDGVLNYEEYYYLYYQCQ